MVYIVERFSMSLGKGRLDLSRCKMLLMITEWGLLCLQKVSVSH
jgi:hypothetical protein